MISGLTATVIGTAIAMVLVITTMVTRNRGRISGILVTGIMIAGTRIMDTRVFRIATAINIVATGTGSLTITYRVRESRSTIKATSQAHRTLANQARVRLMQSPIKYMTLAKR